MKTIENIIEKLQNLTEMKLIILWNQYCDDNSLTDDEIHDNEEYTLNEFFSSVDDALRAAYYGEYYDDKYFKLNAYGNLESFNYPKDYMDLEALAEYVLDNNINL